MNHDDVSDIRAALAAGEFARAQNLWSDYAARVEAAVHDRSATAADLAEMRELVEWTRQVVLSFRSLSTSRLASRRAAAAYTGFPAAHHR
jgi:hypothetical protein